jgi:WD40 repeat protein
VAWAVFNPGGAFTADRFLAVNIDRERVEIYDLREGDLVATFTGADLGGGLPLWMSFNPEGTLLAGSLNNGNAWVVDLAALVEGTSAEEVIAFRQQAHSATIHVDIGPDGLLATAGADSRVRLWDVETGALLLDLRNNLGGDCCRFVEFSPDGRYLYYSDGGDIVRRLPVDVDKLLEMADSRVTRELTDEECRRYIGPEGCR